METQLPIAALSITSKPGPHLSPSTSYRQLAKDHADAAARLLAGCPRDFLDSPDTLAAVAKAQAHALLSLAYTDMAPPARLRLLPDHGRRAVRP